MAPVTCIHYWKRPVNGDLEVGGAVLSFGHSCVRKAGRSESRSAARPVLSASPAQRNRLPLFHPGLPAPLSPRGHGSMAALHTLSSGRIISTDSAQLDLCVLTRNAPDTRGPDVFLLIFRWNSGSF